MDLKNILLYVGIGATVLFLVQYLVQIHRVRSGTNYVSMGRVFVNWMLIFLIVAGFGGSAYASHHAHEEQQTVSDDHSVRKSAEADQIYIRWSKKKAHLDSNGECKLKIVVSPDTKVVIRGHNTHKVFKTFDPKDSDGSVTLHYTFTQDAPYDIIATRGKKKLTKKITIKPYTPASQSSSSSTKASSSSSSRSSSSSSRSNNNSQSNNNGGGSSNSGGGGTSYSGGGGGSYGGYTPSYSGGGGGGGSAPAAPAAPAQPSTPSWNGAMH